MRVSKSAFFPRRMAAMSCSSVRGSSVISSGTRGARPSTGMERDTWAVGRLMGSIVFMRRVGRSLRLPIQVSIQPDLIENHVEGAVDGALVLANDFAGLASEIFAEFWRGKQFFDRP